MCKQYVTDWYATSKANCREDVGGCGMFFPKYYSLLLAI